MLYPLSYEGEPVHTAPARDPVWQATADSAQERPGADGGEHQQARSVDGPRTVPTTAASRTSWAARSNRAASASQPER